MTAKYPAMHSPAIQRVYPIDTDWNGGYFTIDLSDPLLLTEAAKLVVDTVRERLIALGFTEKDGVFVLSEPRSGEQVGYEYCSMGFEQAPDMLRIGGMIGKNNTWEITWGAAVSDALGKIHQLLTNHPGVATE